MVEKAGGNQLTVHLREDRRHIQDQDVKDLRRALSIPLNLEIASEPEMVKIAAKIKPDWVCLVPERRQEVTTEGGLDLKKARTKVLRAVETLHKNKIKVSLFVEPSLDAMKRSLELGADAVEIHTGSYCNATQGAYGKKSKLREKAEFLKIKEAAKLAVKLGLHAHAGHGFDYENVMPVAALTRDGGEPLIEEYNIGHAIVCRAVLVGLEQAIREMAASIHAP